MMFLAVSKFLYCLREKCLDIEFHINALLNIFPFRLIFDSGKALELSANFHVSSTDKVRAVTKENVSLRMIQSFRTPPKPTSPLQQPTLALPLPHYVHFLSHTHTYSSHSTSTNPSPVSHPPDLISLTLFSPPPFPPLCHFLFLNPPQITL